MKFRQLLLLIFFVGSRLLFSAGGTLPGAGTDVNPYEIEDYADLKKIGTNPYTYAKVYKLTNNIDATASIGEDSGKGFKPIGKSWDTFTGKLYGKGHTISNLHINRTTNGVGLFAYIKSAYIDSVGMVNCYIKGRQYVGALCASIENSTVKNCYNTDSVIAILDYTGGIIGQSLNSTIDSCWNSGDILANNTEAGGIAGNSSAGNISNSYNIGTINSYESTGGIVGYTASGTNINNCYNDGAIYASNKEAGGIAGRTSGGTVSSCFNYGEVSGSNYLGGLIGYSGSTIKFCYNVSNISGDIYVGGIAGYATGNLITNCYSSGACSGTSFIGGFAGYLSSSTIRNVYTTADVTGSLASIGGFAGSINSSILDTCYNAGYFSGENFSGGFAGTNFGGTFPNAYFNTETTATTIDIGNDLSSAPPIPGLTIVEMKTQTSINTLDYATIWTIRNDSTYPALTAINNAPFAFPDTIRVSATGATYGVKLDTCLLNDYDSETIKDSLVFKLLSLNNSTIDTMNFYFSSLPLNGDTASILYRIGEKNALLPDTLWGNTAKILMIMDNASPQFQTTNYITNEDSLSLFILNALDIDNDTISYSIYTSSTHGSSIISNDSLTYNPDPDYYGTDSIQLITTDGYASDTSWITITVLPRNDSPIARDTLVNWVAGLPFKIKLPMSDIDDNELTAHISISPTNGSASTNIDSISYTSNPYYIGNDTTQWYATDTSNLSSNISLFVISLATPILLTTKDSIEFDAGGGLDSIDVTSNTQWNAASSATWISISPSTNIGSEKLIITIATNTFNYPREANIIISAPGLADKILKIKQDYIDYTIIDLITDSVSSCNGEAIELNYSILSGNPPECRILFGAKALAVGFTQENFQSTPISKLIMSIPINIPYGEYYADLQFKNSIGTLVSYPFIIDINLPSSTIKNEKYALFIDTVNYKFLEYQWYKNGEIMENENNSSLFDIDGFSGNYQAEVTLTDGTKIFTCDLDTDSAGIAYNLGRVFPSPVRQEEDFYIEISSFIISENDKVEVNIYHTSGKRAHSFTTNKEMNKVSFKKSPGIYIIHLNFNNDWDYTFEIMVIN